MKKAISGPRLGKFHARPPLCCSKESVKIFLLVRVANEAIKQGDIFSEQNVTVKRPEGGLSPMLWDKVLGQPAPRDFAPDEWIAL